MRAGKPKRTAKIDKALRKMREVARDRVAKREIMHFRIDKSSILGLFEMAGKKKQPVSAMVREWVLERLWQEQGDGTKLNAKSIERRLRALEKRLERET